MKTKNQYDPIKLQSFFTAKEAIKKKSPKRQPREQEKIIANEVTDQELIFKIHKHLMELYIKKTKNPIKNGQKV